LQFEGFCDAPDDFQICKYELNRDDWSKGYIMVDAASR